MFFFQIYCAEILTDSREKHIDCISERAMAFQLRWTKCNWNEVKQLDAYVCVTVSILGFSKCTQIY